MCYAVQWDNATRTGVSHCVLPAAKEVLTSIE